MVETETRGRKSSSISEVRERRQKMYELKLMGESTYAIAKQFGISPRQVNLDLRRLYEETLSQTRQIDLNERIRRYTDAGKSRIKRLWLIASNPQVTHRDKVRALIGLREEDKFRSELEARVGILPQDPSPLISIESKSEQGSAENKVIINIIAPAGHKESEIIPQKQPVENVSPEKTEESPENKPENV